MEEKLSKKIKKSGDRGRVVELKLKKTITFNKEIINKAIIEIDHINYGLDPKTGSLKKKKRMSFTPRNIEEFIRLLDNEDETVDRYNGSKSVYIILLVCPVKGKFFGKEFKAIFSTDYKKPEEIHALTLYPNW